MYGKAFFVFFICFILLGCKKFHEADVLIIDDQVTFSFPLNQNAIGAAVVAAGVSQRECSNDCLYWEVYQPIEYSGKEIEVLTSKNIAYGYLPNGLQHRQPPKQLTPGSYMFMAGVWFPVEEGVLESGTYREYVANFTVIGYDETGAIIISEWQPD